MKTLAQIYMYIASTIFTIALIAGIFMITKGRLNFGNDAQNSKLNYSSIGKSLPEIELEDIEGNRVFLEQVISSPTYLGLSASWCAPCKLEYPNLIHLREKQDEFDILMISIDENREDWLKDYKINETVPYRIMQPSDVAILADFLGHNGVPYFSLISEESKLLYPNFMRTIEFVQLLE